MNRYILLVKTVLISDLNHADLWNTVGNQLSDTVAIRLDSLTNNKFMYRGVSVELIGDEKNEEV
jgi:hypothetical protein